MLYLSTFYSMDVWKYTVHIYMDIGYRGLQFLTFVRGVSVENMYVNKNIKQVTQCVILILAEETGKFNSQLKKKATLNSSNYILLIFLTPPRH
jgi:hypothetical protein